MKIIIFYLCLILFQINSFSDERIIARAIGIFDEKGNGENIQHVRKTKKNYNGICYTKIFVTNISKHLRPKVTINNSIGHFQSSKPIFNSEKIKIAEVILYKHYNITSGLIKVFVKNKLYDARVYIK